jgi:uncharacterized Tic20 family protein
MGRERERDKKKRRKKAFSLALLFFLVSVCLSVFFPFFLLRLEKKSEHASDRKSKNYLNPSQ